MSERHHSGGHVLADSVQSENWRPKKRAHRVNVRIDEDLYRELRREEAESGMSLSSVMRGWRWRPVSRPYGSAGSRRPR